MKVVAEVGLSHMGCVGTALAYVDACASAGADAVKFQCHDFDPVDKFRPGWKSLQDRTRQDYWRRTAFLSDQWRMIADRCHERGVEFGLSVFAPMAVQQFMELNKPFAPDFWKLGSGVSTNGEIVLAIGIVPVVASFGMSTNAEISEALRFYDPKQTTVLFCVSKYPTPPEECGVDTLSVIALRRHGFSVGISDHSGTIWPSIAAAQQGLNMTEVHVCWSRECFGPDVPASITIDELRQLVQGVRFVEKMRANPVDKDEMASKLSEMREIFCVPH